MKLYACILTWMLVHVVNGVHGAGDSGRGGASTREFAVHVTGGTHVAQRVARDLGYVFHGQIGSLDDHYLFTLPHPHRRSKRSIRRAAQRLDQDHRVHWSEEQVEVTRVKRDLITKRDQEEAYRSINYRDPDYPSQWYIHDSVTQTTRDSSIPRLDLNILPVWKAGITGKGVVVAVLDDGLERNHTDIKQNYDPNASYDFNDRDNDPQPHYDEGNRNKHGTRCAGEIAMAANNEKCGVGVAYNAKIGGIRMLDGRVTDRLEAEALGFNNDHIDIYSCSWGPNDDGRTVEGPGRLASSTLLNGISKGRGGKGNIYVWASGNGGSVGDNCDCDGYTGSIYTLSISSATQHCQFPWYAERCASTLATTYSSGKSEELRVTSTDLHDTCTRAHTGTSASAPLAAGIIALLLEANPDLTWRDVQHLVVWTAQRDPLADNPGWKQNGAGFWVNSRFGFGLLNAAELVNAADPKIYKTVPDRQNCTFISDNTTEGMPVALSNGQQAVIRIRTTGCRGQHNEINFLEHVQLYVDLDYTKRGDLEIFLISPSGTETMLLSKRNGDESTAGFTNWPFMSVHNWGENPRGLEKNGESGEWKIIVMDTSPNTENVGELLRVRLVLHGTKEEPDIMKRLGRRKYSSIPMDKMRSLKIKPAQDETESELNSLLTLNQIPDLHPELTPEVKLSDVEGTPLRLPSDAELNLLPSRSRGRYEQEVMEKIADIVELENQQYQQEMEMERLYPSAQQQQQQQQYQEKQQHQEQEQLQEEQEQKIVLPEEFESNVYDNNVKENQRNSYEQQNVRPVNLEDLVDLNYEFTDHDDNVRDYPYHEHNPRLRSKLASVENSNRDYLYGFDTIDSGEGAYVDVRNEREYSREEVDNDRELLKKLLSLIQEGESL